MGNYIKIDRKILEWEWYSNINTCRLFIHMLLKANWKDGKFEGKVIPRGSFVSSYPKLESETQLTNREIRTSIQHLKKTGELTVKTTNKYSIFTINNYNQYQIGDSQNDSLTTDKRQSNDSLTSAIEEKKEIKEGNKGIYKQIIDLYNDICVSFPRVTKLSENRKKALNARLKMYDIDDFKRLFELAEQNNFLKGGNDRNWSANFDWLIKDSNMAKVLDGNYNNSAGKPKYHRPKNAKPIMENNYDTNLLEKQAREARDKRLKEMKKNMEKGNRDEHK